MFTPSQNPKHILLLGAGELGLSLLSSLSTLPSTQITLGIRSPSKYSHLESSNIQLTQLDLSSPSSQLSETFSHFDVLST
jgi:saccharopine dehydrogenase-like NADP-dependent oxidoreductase